MLKTVVSMWAVAAVCGGALTWPAFAGRSEVTVICHDGPGRGRYVVARRDVIDTHDGLVIVTRGGRVIVDRACEVRP